jgi:hypothetical protein
MAMCQKQRGRLGLVSLKAKDQILGVEYSYTFGSRTHALIRGYSDQPEWRSYSIGRMLHCQMIRQAIARGATLMDDGRGSFEYKRRLGGQLRWERSVTAVRRSGSSRLRVWLAMRAAWCIHAVYDRLWFDWLRPQLHLPARSLRRSYIRMSFLAHLYKRTRFHLWPPPAKDRADIRWMEPPGADLAIADSAAAPEAVTTPVRGRRIAGAGGNGKGMSAV